VFLFSFNDDSVPVLPPKRDKNPISSSTMIISKRSRSNGSTNSLLFTSSPNKIQPDKDNDECIQLIVDDINQIVEKYTRELDDAIRTKTANRSSSIDHLSNQNCSITLTSSCRHNRSIDTLYETQISKIMKSTITKTTINNGHGIIDKKESCQLYNETDCSIQLPKGNFQSQKFTLINREKLNDNDEQQKTIMTSQINQLNVSDNDHTIHDPPPLPPKRKTGFLFRYFKLNPI
jgi:hypothetical protein